MMQISKRQNLTTKEGLIRPRDLKSLGMSRSLAYEMLKKGQLQKNARGLYSLQDSAFSENITLAEVTKQVPHAVISLVTALKFHKLTTQLPYEVWITVPRGAWRPKLDFVALNLSYVSGKPLSFGITQHNVDGVTINVYGIAKTLADCFKFRSKVGLDIALEALKEAWTTKRVTMAELTEAAEVCRVQNVMRPYLESLP